MGKTFSMRYYFVPLCFVPLAPVGHNGARWDHRGCTGKSSVKLWQDLGDGLTDTDIFSTL